jgi:hypothetical protein
MSQTTTIPVTVTPEAAARVAELGMQKQLNQMVQHALEMVTKLLSIEVNLAPPTIPATHRASSSRPFALALCCCLIAPRMT